MTLPGIARTSESKSSQIAATDTLRELLIKSLTSVSTLSDRVPFNAPPLAAQTEAFDETMNDARVASRRMAKKVETLERASAVALADAANSSTRDLLRSRSDFTEIETCLAVAGPALNELEEAIKALAFASLPTTSTQVNDATVGDLRAALRKCLRCVGALDKYAPNPDRPPTMVVGSTRRALARVHALVGFLLGASLLGFLSCRHDEAVDHRWQQTVRDAALDLRTADEFVETACQEVFRFARAEKINSKGHRCESASTDTALDANYAAQSRDDKRLEVLRQLGGARAAVAGAQQSLGTVLAQSRPTDTSRNSVSRTKFRIAGGRNSSVDVLSSRLETQYKELKDLKESEVATTESAFASTAWSMANTLSQQLSLLTSAVCGLGIQNGACKPNRNGRLEIVVADSASLGLTASDRAILGDSRLEVLYRMSIALAIALIGYGIIAAAVAILTAFGVRVVLDKVFEKLPDKGVGLLAYAVPVLLPVGVAAGLATSYKAADPETQIRVIKFANDSALKAISEQLGAVARADSARDLAIYQKAQDIFYRAQ